jgi:hypothetical protein
VLYRYIIDHYDKLPDLVVFMHDARYQWHNDDPIYGTCLPNLIFKTYKSDLY